MKKKYPDLKVVQFDAHADMRQDYQGSPFSHAAVACCISEICPLVQIGIRSMSVEEADYLKKSKSHIFPAERAHDDPDVMKKICKIL
jgi:agmatinase